MNLVFIGMTFTNLGRKLEGTKGTTALLLQLLAVSLLTNTLFLTLMVILQICTDNPAFLLTKSQGFWPPLLSLITIDSNAPGNEGTTRRLLFLPVQIPTNYYPMALCALFTLFMGFRLDFILALGIGYAWDADAAPLNFIKPNASRIERLETGLLASMTSRAGWITRDSAGSAVGSEGLPTTSTVTGAGSGFSSFFSGRGGQQQHPTQPSSTASSTIAGPPAGGWGGARNAATISSTPEPGAIKATVGGGVFPGGGQAVGTSSEGVRANVDGREAREAMVRAAETRSANAASSGRGK